jgi:hypothetical protein
MSDSIAALIPAALLILAALGDATAMFVVSAIALVVLAFFSRRDFGWGGVFAAMFACVVALAISVVMMLRF